MKKVTLTLELTYAEAKKVLDLLNKSSESFSEPTSYDKLEKISLPAKEEKALVTSKTVVTTPTPKPGGKQSAKMPAFGRTQKQVNEFLEHESTRVEKLDEEAEVKAQRKEEREAIAEEKDKEAKAIIKEVEDIKAADTIKSETTDMPKKLWNL